MQTAGPTPLRYYNSSKDRPLDRLDFRKRQKRPARVWPFLLVVVLTAGAAVGLLTFMKDDPGGVVATVPAVDSATQSGG
jgi:hypothetical protein